MSIVPIAAEPAMPPLQIANGSLRRIAPV